MGFIWSAVGSAIGLGSIWRFPYVVGANGGGIFIAVYVICLICTGLPVLISEILIGKKARLNAAGSLRKVGNGNIWGVFGNLTLLTSFLVSCFYCVIAAWVLGYFMQAIAGKLLHLDKASKAIDYFLEFKSSVVSVSIFLVIFLIWSMGILYSGIKKGIEASNKVMIPLLLIILLALSVKGCFDSGGIKALKFLFLPNWKEFTPRVVLIALGQSFFALSLGQGTMITYGSYLRKNDGVISSCFAIAFFSLVISILAGIAIFTVVFSSGFSPSAGESLMFQTLPVIFTSFKGGYILEVIFFFLLLLAAITSQISAMEPFVAYLIDNWKFKRALSVGVVGGSIGIFSLILVLSFGPLSFVQIYKQNVFDITLNVCLDILIPIGGLVAILAVGWRWGVKNALALAIPSKKSNMKQMWFVNYLLFFFIKYISPIIILLVMFYEANLFLILAG